MPCCVIMGVAGCGKSTVGRGVGEIVGALYRDGDDLHPSANIAKMTAGMPLTDEDRWPWLDLVGLALRDASMPALVGCSALKRKYRDRIREAAGKPVVFLHLAGSREVIEGRMSARDGHFMPVSLLDSQFAALEPLEPDEPGFSVDIAGTFDDVVAEAARRLLAEAAWAAADQG